MLLRRGATWASRGAVLQRSFATDAALLLQCSGCGELVDGSTQPVFKCPQSETPEGKGVDHVLVPQPVAGSYDHNLNPFLRYRSRLYSHRVAMARGMDDDHYVAMVNEIDNALVQIDGCGFTETPLRWCVDPPQ